MVFPNRDGKTCRPQNIRTQLYSKSTTLQNRGYDIPNISPHMLRHTFATRCYESGINILVISKLLGHSSVEMTTSIYTHVLDENIAKEIEKLELEY